MKESLLNFDGWLDLIRSDPKAQTVWSSRCSVCLALKGRNTSINEYAINLEDHTVLIASGVCRICWDFCSFLLTLWDLCLSHTAPIVQSLFRRGNLTSRPSGFVLASASTVPWKKITSKEWDQQFYQAPDEAKPVTVHPLYILWTKKTRYTFGHPDLLSVAVPNSAGHLKLDHQTHLNSFGLKSKVNGRMTGVT